MTREELFNQIKAKRSYLCVGLDVDLDKVPKHLLEFEDPIFEFNKRIIDATKDLCVAYKPNTAFYERYGVDGWKALEKTINYIPNDIFTIADAKRGDIGNTSKYYAQAFLQKLNFDSITVAPYMGHDSVLPFTEFENKWVILLALTSNPGALDFQLLPNRNNEKLFQQVIEKSKEWGTSSNMMYVVGATQASMLKEIRDIIPDHFLLVPGVGAQGGNLEEVARYGLNTECGLLINSSRGIIYAGEGENFEEDVRKAAFTVQQSMEQTLFDHHLISK